MYIHTHACIYAHRKGEREREREDIVCSPKLEFSNIEIPRIVFDILVSKDALSPVGSNPCRV